ncbi:glycosyltransferase family 2, chitin synthase [Obelidium mucronatum]|nr:glycosyltransferase family 2, chitin synthase [Obelidium mucronatum]
MSSPSPSQPYQRVADDAAAAAAAAAVPAAYKDPVASQSPAASFFGFPPPPPPGQQQPQQYLYQPLLGPSAPGSYQSYSQYPPPPSQHQQFQFGTFGPMSQSVGIPMDTLGFRRGTTFLRKPTKMVKQEIELVQGEFILDVPLSSDYAANVRYKEDEEFTHLRYTAVTQQADDYATSYTLRQKEKGRRTKIAVVCTMYNEDEQLFTKTMSAVMDNIAYLCTFNGKKGWDANSWRDIVVVIVSDGVKPCNPRTLEVLGAMGCYMEGLQRGVVNGKSVHAHLFEFTTQVRISQKLEPKFCTNENNKIVPMQTIFLLKEKNAKKINSHRWFFNAVCKVLDPEVCILIDVGTKPTKQSFYHLYRAFERNGNVAGACGEIAAELGPAWRNLMNPLVAVQNFEYKMSNILDKPLESVFGYISVLPGAFSAYRYQALQGQPLAQYFKGEALHNDHTIEKPNVSESNMYLAEDRILCFELVMKREKRYILKYVKSAKAETDVPTEFSDLIKQRRRWFNGSFFASVYAVQNFYRIFGSDHTIFRKFMLLVETFYNAINLVYSWFNIGSIYCCFYFMFNITSDKLIAACTSGIVSKPGQDLFYPYSGAVSTVMRGVYIGTFITMVIASLGNKPDTIRPLLVIIAVIFALLMVLMLTLIVWTIYIQIRDIPDFVESFSDLMAYLPTNPNFYNLVISLLSTYVLYIVSSLIYLDPWHPFTCLLQYLLMTPSFSNILMVYAFCNIHDISWGTKGQDSTPSGPTVQTNKNEKGKQVTTTEVPAPDYGNELAKLKEMAIELSNPHAVVERSSSRKTSEDHFKAYRTYVLMFWFLSNFILVFVLTNEYVMRAMSSATVTILKDGTKINGPNPFLIFLLWSIVGLTGIRFAGSMVYWVQWVLERGADAVM